MDKSPRLSPRAFPTFSHQTQFFFFLLGQLFLSAIRQLEKQLCLNSCFPCTAISPSNTSWYILQKDTQSCNSILVVKACQAMTTGSCLLAPSYLSDMSGCCINSSHLARGYLSTRQSRQILSSHLCPCSGRDFQGLWRGGTCRDPSRPELDGFSLRGNAVTSQRSHVRSYCYQSLKHIKQIPGPIGLVSVICLSRRCLKMGWWYLWQDTWSSSWISLLCSLRRLRFHQLLSQLCPLEVGIFVAWKISCFH